MDLGVTSNTVAEIHNEFAVVVSLIDIVKATNGTFEAATQNGYDILAHGYRPQQTLRVV